MTSLTEPERRSRRFGWLSLCMVLVPVGYFGMLLSGGGSSGFGAWGDLAFLLGLMIASSVIGLVFSFISIRRDEQSVVAYFAMLIHFTLIALAVHALLQ
jgi:hypothetical protein